MIPYTRHHLDDDDIQAVVDCLRSDRLTQGPRVAQFEHEVASYVGARFAVAVSSGTAALHLAVLAAGVSPGDSVVTSPMTFVATANAAAAVGATLAFADVDPRELNISAPILAELLAQQPSVRAVIPVHFAGLPCDMVAIERAVDTRHTVIIEDAAHALGARYADGTLVGCCAHSDMTVFSFHPAKVIATGEGGMITTNAEPMYERLLLLRSHGISRRAESFRYVDAAQSGGQENPWYYEMQTLGFNYRITDIQCALGLSQMRKLERFLSRRRDLVARYDSMLSDMAMVQPAQGVGRELSAHHLYPVRIDYERAGRTRADLMKYLHDHGVDCQVHYIPVPAHPYYRDLGFRPEDYPSACAYYHQALSLPLYFDLTDSQQDHVLDLLRRSLA